MTSDSQHSQRQRRTAPSGKPISVLTLSVVARSLAAIVLCLPLWLAVYWAVQLP
ncbi:hypothetical protein [Carnimonas bestiolae]|uniref:hypothetical protein n=1 Tax=Carnimonas bestiolae TaxID=3402172 RepID=UPI003F4AAF10